MVRVTIRATNEDVPAALLKLMEDRLSAGAAVEERNEMARQHVSDPFGNVVVA